MTVHVAYDKRLLNWVLSEGHPSNPIRARLTLDRLEAAEVPMQVHRLRDATLDELRLVHAPGYLYEVLIEGRCSEWAGVRPDLSGTARLMFGGTMHLVDLLLERDDVKLAFAPQGAKHHAMRDHASGFCVFNDFAAAALRLRDAGHRVLYVDWDAHHGDGVEALLRDEKDIVTCSIHDSTIFPGTGWHTEPNAGVYNWPLAGYAGDYGLLTCIEEVVTLGREFKPTALLVAAGADGHRRDPLSSLEYTYAGLSEAATLVATGLESVEKTLIGGAGGYEPFTVVPRVWADTVAQFAQAERERALAA